MSHDSRYETECPHGHGWYFYEDGCSVAGCENAPASPVCGECGAPVTQYDETPHRADCSAASPVRDPAPPTCDHCKGPMELIWVCDHKHPVVYRLARSAGIELGVRKSAPPDLDAAALSAAEKVYWQDDGVSRHNLAAAIRAYLAVRGVRDPAPPDAIRRVLERFERTDCDDQSGGYESSCDECDGKGEAGRAETIAHKPNCVIGGLRGVRDPSPPEPTDREIGLRSALNAALVDLRIFRGVDDHFVQALEKLVEQTGVRGAGVVPSAPSREQLKEIEWAKEKAGWTSRVACCPVCYGPQHQRFLGHEDEAGNPQYEPAGHKSDCWLGQAVGGLSSAAAPPEDEITRAVQDDITNEVLEALWNGDIKLSAEQRLWIRQALDVQDRGVDSGGVPSGEKP